MGGNALKKLSTSRLAKEDYKKVETDVIQRLKKEEKRCFVPRYFSDKESFGDLDVVISNIDKEFIEKIFSPEEIFENGNIFSFSYNFEDKIFQIDFIIVSEKNFRFASFYYSFGDTGAIIGAMSKAWGLTFSDKGLFHNFCYNFGESGTFIKKIFLTDDISEALDSEGLYLSKIVEKLFRLKIKI